MSEEFFTSPCPPPTPAERELLDNLIEECAEVIQRCTKADRFGFDETQPGQPYSNRDRLAHEVGDVLAMIDLLTERGLIPRSLVDMAAMKKRRNFRKYAQIVENRK